MSENFWQPPTYITKNNLFTHKYNSNLTVKQKCNILIEVLLYRTVIFAFQYCKYIRCIFNVSPHLYAIIQVRHFTPLELKNQTKLAQQFRKRKLSEKNKIYIEILKETMFETIGNTIDRSLIIQLLGIILCKYCNLYNSFRFCKIFLTCFMLYCRDKCLIKIKGISSDLLCELHPRQDNVSICFYQI